MAKESVIITATKNGKTIQKSLTDMNPEATNAQLATFGTMLNALTTNTYQKTDRITKVNCDTEPGGGTKPTPTLTLDQTTVAAADLPTLGGSTLNFFNIAATTNSDGNLYARFDTSVAAYQQPCVFGTSTGFSLVKASGFSVIAQTVYIGVTETDSYKGVEVEFTITA